MTRSGSLLVQVRRLGPALLSRSDQILLNLSLAPPTAPPHQSPETVLQVDGL